MSCYCSMQPAKACATAQSTPCLFSSVCWSAVPTSVPAATPGGPGSSLGLMMTAKEYQAVRILASACPQEALVQTDMCCDGIAPHERAVLSTRSCRFSRRAAQYMVSGPHTQPGVGEAYHAFVSTCRQCIHADAKLRFVLPAGEAARSVACTLLGREGLQGVRG